MRNTQRNELAVCGMSAVKKLEKRNSDVIRRLYFTQDTAPKFGGLCKKLAARGGIYNVVDSGDLERLCGSIHHQGVVAMIECPAITPLDSEITDSWIENGENALLLDHIGNANNLGAIVRSAAFFGMKNIIITNDEATSSITTSSYRIAEGGMEFVHIYSVNSVPRLMQALEGGMFRIGSSLTASTPAREMRTLAKRRPVLLAVGNEERGISAAAASLCDALVVIPGSEAETSERNIESLNVAQASSILLYELTR